MWRILKPMRKSGMVTPFWPSQMTIWGLPPTMLSPPNQTTNHFLIILPWLFTKPTLPLNHSSLQQLKVVIKLRPQDSMFKSTTITMTTITTTTMFINISSNRKCGLGSNNKSNGENGSSWQKGSNSVQVVEGDQRARPTNIREWDKYIQFWNDPRNVARAAQNQQNRAKSMVISRQGSRSLARLRDEMFELGGASGSDGCGDDEEGADDQDDEDEDGDGDT
nr:hypothetical protein [Tanacetum cinerariifolium]